MPSLPHPSAGQPAVLPDDGLPADLPRLQAGALTAVLAPDCGGAVAAFYRREADGRLTHWLRPATPEALAARDPLRCASFPLVPWCNRIRDGRGGFGGRRFALPSNFQGTPHTIHGTGWQQPWQVLVRQRTQLHLGLQHQPVDPATLPWPWSFEAEQRIELDAQAGLTLSLSARNTDTVPMPLGLGHHPYLPRRGGLRLRTAVDAVWTRDAEQLPTGLDAQAPVLQALRQGTDLADWVLDSNFNGWCREAVLHWPAEGLGLRLQADAGLEHLVVYSPAGLDFCCVEPVGNTTDWLNLAEAGDRRAGGVVLQPGQTHTVRCRLTPWPDAVAAGAAA